MLPGTLQAPSTGLRQALVWVLALAILAQGQVAALVQLLGPVHWHAPVAEQAAQRWVPGLIDEAASLFSDIRDWRAGLRARLLHGTAPEATATGGAHRHPHPDLHPHPHPHPDPHASAQAAPSHAGHATGDEPEHAHAHAVSQRHHHSPIDPTLVTLDGGAGASGLDAAAQAAAGSVTLPLALAPAWAVPSPCVGAACWPADPSGEWADAPQRRADPPPRS